MILRFLLNILFHMFLYLCLLTFFEYNNRVFRSPGILNETLNLTKYTESKSNHLIQHLAYPNLAVNFLSNQRTLSDDEKIAFQSSGLIHLLAVSGAQIMPVCSLIGFFLMNVFYFCTKKYFSSSCLMKYIFYFKSVVFLCISLLMTGLFSCTGALLRVTFFYSLNEFFKSQKYIYLISEVCPIISDGLVRRILLLTIVTILFGNIFYDYSFLLSTIGASILEICALCLNLFLKSLKIKKRLKFVLHPILLSLMTSFSVSLILYPVSKVSLINSSFSNILAGPIVTFIITPLSLLLLFLPGNSFVQDYLLSLFDYSLGALNFIAQIFLDKNYDLNIPKILLFSYEGKTYLIIILIMLFAVIDVVRSRDLQYLRYVFKKTKKII